MTRHLMKASRYQKRNTKNQREYRITIRKDNLWRRKSRLKLKRKRNFKNYD